MRISDWSADVCSSDRSSRQRRGQEGARALALAALEVAIAGRDRELPRADQIAVHGDAHGTAGHAPLGAGRAHDRVDAFVLDRKRVVSGKSVSVRVDIGGRRTIKKNNTHTKSSKKIIHIL